MSRHIPSSFHHDERVLAQNRDAPNVAEELAPESVGTEIDCRNYKSDLDLRREVCVELTGFTIFFGKLRDLVAKSASPSVLFKQRQVCGLVSSLRSTSHVQERALRYGKDL